MPPSRPNLLLVSYFFPPAATGVRRVVSLVRHLPDHGWRPLVLTAPHVVGAGHDDGPLDDAIVRSTPVVRAESWDPYRLAAWWRGAAETPSATPGTARAAGGWGPWIMAALRAHVLVPDDRCGWIPAAVDRGVDAIRRHRLRAIYSTNYPHTAHVVAWRIARRTGLPWIAEFRDGWTQNPAFFAPGNALVRAAQHGLEAAVARDATAIITVSPPVTRHMQRLRGTDDGRLPAVTIYNGFESAAAPDDPRSAPREPLMPGRRTLLYTGTFFGRRRPDAFLAGLAWAMRRDAALAARWCVWLRAELDARSRSLIERWRLGDVVRVLPPVPFAQCTAEQARADACLLVLEHGPGADIMVSQKVFEYLAARRPIFALVPQGAAAELLAETGGATTQTSQRPADVGPALATFLAQVEAGAVAPPREDVLARFDRRAQTAAIAAVIDQACSRR